MTTKDELLKTRFQLNMGRISGLVLLLNSTDALKPMGLFRSEGASADILRSIVVFLQATIREMLEKTLVTLKSTDATLSRDVSVLEPDLR